MSEFKNKRTSLESFVEEQIIGPGAYNKQFFFLKDWVNCDFAGKKIKEEKALDNISEVIPEVPAYQYSSGILFPRTEIKATAPTDNEVDIQSLNIEFKDELVIENTSIDDELIKEDTNNAIESLVSKQQNYPDTIGLIFVVDRNSDLQKLKIDVSFRRYMPVSKKNCCEREIAYWVSEYESEIETAIEKYFNSVFKIEKRDNNTFVTVKSNILESDDIIYEIDYKYLNSFLNDNLIKALLDNFKIETLVKEGQSYFGIENTSLYLVKDKKYNNVIYSNVISLNENNLIEYLKRQLNIDVKNYQNIQLIIKQLEIYYQLKQIVTNLKSIFKKNQATPIWESKLFCETILLPEHDKSKKIERIKSKSINLENSDVKDLEYSVQYIEQKEKLYIKILLKNNSFITLTEGEPPQLNKKNEANKKSFFGIKLTVRENEQNQLLPYNSPQLLDIDEEDNFNKLLYRQYKDYGEGYNTSVNWGADSEGFRFVYTEFLPKLESPKVDFKPNRITNKRILSMRYLSTLSDASDEEILSGLYLFVNDYKKWIKEKTEEILKGTDIEEEKDIFIKQLIACDKDALRLERNIDLLKRNNSKGIIAFRVMNTAMFMQLHHSINIKKQKKDKSVFSPDSIDEAYYKAVQLENEYEWRSFQLAFVLLNIDAFIKPDADENIVEDVFGTGWPERNEIADLVWFPTGGGKTEAYLGIIAFAIAYRRFTKGSKAGGTTVLMRYTLRLLTLQQFQRATLLICALEAIRKDGFKIPRFCSLGAERITIGLFVGESSLPNKWDGDKESMRNELINISNRIEKGRIATKLPFTECPWCGSELFINNNLSNINPNHKQGDYGLKNQLNICCNNRCCSFKGRGNDNLPNANESLPLRLFDEDIYKFPPTLLFGTVDKFAALANKVSNESGGRNQDSRRLIGKGWLQGGQRDVLPPELIIQDELHLLLGPLGTAVGLYEKGIDSLCTYSDENGRKIRPKIITSTATTRNTDKQIFALFNRRAEIFPKQGISCDDSFFAYYERDQNNKYVSNRKYFGILPVGKTQVWMQLRIASITLTHRLKYLKEKYCLNDLFSDTSCLKELEDVFDYYHTILSYFNSLKDIGKTQSQLSHYLPGDVDYITRNTIPWSFIDKIIRKNEINYSELTGRLSGEEVKSNLSSIEKKWNLLSPDEESKAIQLNQDNPPEFVISTNMISVGIDVSRFNTMIISSMPRNIAEYIQASSRVARNREGIVFTIHHPFRSRDISHFQKFKEFHEKFYSYVEPISVTPFASKALDRYLAMFMAVIIRHDETLHLMNDSQVSNIDSPKVEKIKKIISSEIQMLLENSKKLNSYLINRDKGVRSNVDGIISEEECNDLNYKLNKLLTIWTNRTLDGSLINFKNYQNPLMSLFVSVENDRYSNHWKVSDSLREINPSTVIKTVQQ